MREFNPATDPNPGDIICSKCGVTSYDGNGNCIACGGTNVAPRWIWWLKGMEYIRGPLGGRMMHSEDIPSYMAHA